jgi:hypothetical protein
MRIGSAVKGVVLVVVWPETGLAGGAGPSRAPGKYGGSTQGPSLWSWGGAGNSVRSHGGWAACGGGATRDWEAAGRGRGSPRGSRPRHLLPGWIPVEERLLMSAQAPLTTLITLVNDSEYSQSARQ